MQSPLLLFQSISKHIQLSTEEETLIMSFLQAKKLKKKQFVLQEGDINYSAKFVLSGLLRLYAIDKSGFEHIIQFAPAGWWITDMQSYLSQSPGTLFIDALEETEYVEIKKQDMDQLYQQIPKLERFFRILAENALAAQQQRMAATLTLTAKERYSCFIDLYPGLGQQVPQKYVASYIGVTPEFFSKMLHQPNNESKT